MRVPIFEPRDARVALLPHHRRLVKPVAAAAIQKPHLGIEVPADLDDAREVAPGTRLVPEPRAVRRRVAVGAGGGGCRAPPVDRPRVAGADAAVEAVHPGPRFPLRRGPPPRRGGAPARAGGPLAL